MDYEDLKPAPEPLNLVQQFINTRNYLYGGDGSETSKRQTHGSPTVGCSRRAIGSRRRTGDAW
jgi:hypothetical protein